MYSSIVSERPKPLLKLFCNFILVRNMGGGPRTFPGGVNKWKWKRMHEKRARDKEKRLLDQEKQLYQARIRSHIRAKLAAKSDISSATHNPMGPEDHIKVLANRFMKDGAEDLWNRNDGPLKTPPPPPKQFPGPTRRTGSIGSPVDLRKLIPEARHNLRNISGNHAQTRDYSVQNRRMFRRNESSSDDEDTSSSSERVHARPNIKKSVSSQKSPIMANTNDYLNNKKNMPKRRRKVWRDDSSSSGSDSDLDSESLRIGRDVNKIGSSASLGKYDVKKTKRRLPPKPYDEESDLSEQVELIRYELNKRKMAENEQPKDEEETLLSQRRYSN